MTLSPDQRTLADTHNPPCVLSLSLLLLFFICSSIYIFAQRISDLVALVALLRSLPADAAVHAAGWKRLAELTVSSEPRRAAAGEAGACAVLAVALTQHQLDAAVAEQACGAMRNLTCLPANKERAGAAGAAAAPVAAMTVWPKKAMLQGHATVALYTLILCAANVPRVAAAGERAALTRALAAHPSSDDIQRWGASALQRLLL